MMEGVFCFILCFGSLKVPEPVATDTFCQTYAQVVITQVELDAVRKLPRGLRDRIQGNDLDFLCRCQNWKDPVCQGRGSTGQ